MIKLTTFEVAQREMREIDIPQFPGSSLRGIAANSLPEESQLKSKPVAIRRFQISGVVPPFGLIVRMIEVIARELVAVSRQGGSVLSGKRLQRQKRDSDTSELTPHVRPRRSEEHTSELQSLTNLVCRLLLEKKKTKKNNHRMNQSQV